MRKFSRHTFVSPQRRSVDSSPLAKTSRRVTQARINQEEIRAQMSSHVMELNLENGTETGTEKKTFCACVLVQRRCVLGDR